MKTIRKKLKELYWHIVFFGHHWMFDPYLPKPYDKVCRICGKKGVIVV